MHEFQEIVKLRCQLQAFSNSEIMNMIDDDVIVDIKLKDKHPFFQAYSICHEGISTPTLIGEKAKPINWGRKAIQSIKDVVKKGVKFFFGHNDDNSTEGRKALGEIVGYKEKEIDGKLNSVIVGYFPPETKEEVKKYDICSQEAVWNFFESAGQLIAGTIDKLTGIALSSSEVDKPAFSGAKRLGFVQAFENKDIGENKMDGKSAITFEDVKHAIREMNIHPSQLYNLDEIKKDREFGNIVENENKITEFEDQKKKLEDSLKVATRQNQLNTAKGRLADIMKDMQLTEKEVKYIDTQFSETVDDISDEGLKGFVETQKNICKDVISFFGVKDDDITIKTGDGLDGGDSTKASSNPLLEEDYEED